MSDSYISVLSVIWEECVDKKLCIKLPIIGKKCVRIQACVRVVQESGTIYVEVEAFGKRWRYALTNACHTILEWGIGRLRLCVKTISGGVRIVLEGCIAVDGIKKCWTLIGKEIRFLKMSKLSEGELMMLGFADPTIKGFSLVPEEEVGAVESELTGPEIDEIIGQKDV